jgi:hypothetical protein
MVTPDRREVLASFGAPVLVVTRGISSRPRLAGWNVSADRVTDVTLAYGGLFTDVELEITTWSPAGDPPSRREIAEREFARVLPPTGDRSAEPPDFPTARGFAFTPLTPTPAQQRAWDEEAIHAQMMVRVALVRARTGEAAIVVDGAEHPAYRIQHPDAFAIVLTPPHGGAAAVTGAGMQPDDLELSLTTDPLAVVDLGPWN